MWSLVVLIAISAPALAKLLSFESPPVLPYLFWRQANYLHACARNSTDFNDCVLNRIMVLMPHLAKGVPELHIPSLEPLTVPMVHLEQSSNAIKLKMTLRDVNIRGMSMYLFRTFELNLGPMPNARGLLWIPRIMLDADYEVDGKVLLVPLKGKSHLYCNATSVTGDLRVELQRKLVNGNQYLDPLNTNIKLEIGHASTVLGDVFHNQQIGQVTNMFVNDNWKQIVEEMKPTAESVISMVVQDVVSKVLRSTPENDLII